MAIHYIQIDREEYPSGATTGTSLAYSSGYTKDITFSWDSDVVTRRDVLLDHIEKIQSFIENDILRNGGGVDAPKGYSISIGETENEVTYDNGGGLATNSILENGDDVGIEGGFVGNTFSKHVILNGIDRLKIALANVDFPLA